MTEHVTQRMKDNAAVARRAAAEGMVVLKNEGEVLPLADGSRVAVFGIGQIYTIKGGTGSGEVNNLSSVNFLTGLRSCYAVDETIAAVYETWAGSHPMVRQGLFAGTKSINFNEETPLDGIDLAAAAARNDAAVYVISRIAGEGEDMEPKKGTILLTDAEQQALREVCAAFPKTVLLLNTAGYMEIADLIPLVDAVVFTGLPGQEGGYAAADVLSGAVPAGGRLNDTWPLTWRDAYDYESYSAFLPSGHITPGSFGTGPAEQTLVPYREDIYVGYRYYDTFGKAVLYPFGYGLSYGRPVISQESVRLAGETVTVRATVTNESTKYAAKEVVQVYVSAPDGRLEKPYQDLRGYRKTALLAPGAQEAVEISFPLADLASYDEDSASWILEPGFYYVRVGSHSRNTAIAGALEVRSELVSEQLTNRMGSLPEGFARLRKDGAQPFSYDGEEEEKEAAAERAIPVMQLPLRQRAAAAVQAPAKAREGITFKDVAAGRATEAELAASMDTADLAAFVCGIGMDFTAFDMSAVNEEMEKRRQEDPEEAEKIADQFVSMAAQAEYAPVFTVRGEAGQTPDLSEKYALPPLTLADGPAGVRLTRDIEEEGEITGHQYCTAFPTGSLLACTFDPELIELFGRAAGTEMDEYGVDLWLAPGMNIHRSALCGRNFEYYSEDPLVSGLCAAAVTRGVQSLGGGVTIKHFAGNEQEFLRANSNDLVSERALREIYLRGFEICVRRAAPKAVMTSYNDINGVPSADNRDLLTGILRSEWGFDGLVMTDWGGGVSTPSISVYAGNDMIQPGGPQCVEKLLEDVTAGKEVISNGMAGVCHVPCRADLEQSAVHIMQVMRRCRPCMERLKELS